ncbi:hypothetical protein TSUD_396400 [Trifolium subterraneum]|uniref:Reverse transcriptase domain-containing protein n=1 Tax=Trifolium subterraneum TaxID=3900 RepID=A0A2Z6NQB1_TRISU|nr:hypothetical protein TSUD_396400 [Trifolium subterraneum]
MRPTTAIPLPTGENSHRTTGIEDLAVTPTATQCEQDEHGDAQLQNLENPTNTSEEKKLWVDVLSGNRNPGKGMKMEFVSPKVVNGEIEVEIEASDVISEIGSPLGTPLVTDECTANKFRISYARILVEMDITQELPTDITITDSEGGKLKQPVEYEWKPTFCDKCQKFGHKCGVKKRPMQNWMPKTTTKEVTGDQKVNGEQKSTNQKVAARTKQQSEDTHNTDPANGEWTTVSKGGRDRGKKPASTTGPICDNGFETLVGKIREISSRLLDLNPDIAILIETRVKQNKAENIRNKLKLRGDWLYWMTAIYAQNHLEKRRRLWKDIENIHAHQSGPWFLMGDFNNVLKSQDRIGGRTVTESEYRDLSTMMEITSLYEMDSTGDHYTWSNKQSDCAIYSQIDRVIVNLDWLQIDYTLHVMHPSVSDHALLCLNNITGTRTTKRNHFKFLNSTADLDGFLHAVATSWHQHISGRPMYVLWKKLQRLQPVLRQISKPLSDIKLHISQAREKLLKAQLNLSLDRMSADKIDVDGTQITNQEEIEDEVLAFYNKLMGTADTDLLGIDITVMRDSPQLNTDQKGKLVAPITDKEIEAAMQSIGDLKSPGMDGYGAYFFKKAWNIVKPDVLGAVHDFFENGRLYKAANCTLVTLIPKTPEAKRIKEYRPISCCSTIYKIISKILTKRMGEVMTSIVGQNQAAFVPGQIIHNHILLTYELIKGYNRNGGTPRCMMQLDLQKAYDTIDWNAMECVLNEVGFPKQFTKWIMIAVTSVSYRFNINGNHTTVMKANRGLRQGDPISPLLFFIMMEYLNRCFQKLQKNHNFNFHAKCEKLSLTNLCFADDILLFSRGDAGSVSLMLETFEKFSKSTGLKVNPSKCCIFFGGVDQCTLDDIKRITRFEEGKLPFRYLGIPMTSKKLAIHHYMGLIDKIVGRITHWSSKLLSYAGRIQLLQNVIFAMTNYWLQCLPFPRAVLHKINSICRTFFWTGSVEKSRKIPIAWTSVCQPKCHSGLNLIDIEVWNRITLLKLLWNLCGKSDSLWDGSPVMWRTLFYGNMARPRALVHLWITCNERLATRDRETKGIWKKVLEWIQIDHNPPGWHQELEWIIRKTKGKGGRAKILKLAFSECVYEIWRYRNNVSFSSAVQEQPIVSRIIDTIVYRGLFYHGDGAVGCSLLCTILSSSAKRLKESDLVRDSANKLFEVIGKLVVGAIERPFKFEGLHFKRWQQKMFFFLTLKKVVHVLSDEMPLVVTAGSSSGTTQTLTINGENGEKSDAEKQKEKDSIDPVAQIKAQELQLKKEQQLWLDNDYLCKGYIINGLCDDLYDYYSTYKSAKDVWEALKKKYDTEEAGVKKYAVSRYLKYQMVDERSVEAQSHELQKIAHEIIIEEESRRQDQKEEAYVVIGNKKKFGAVLKPGGKPFKNQNRGQMNRNKNGNPARAHNAKQQPPTNDNVAGGASG